MLQQGNLDASNLAGAGRAFLFGVLAARDHIARCGATELARRVPVEAGSSRGEVHRARPCGNLHDMD
jgi:hypothetical protein